MIDYKERSHCRAALMQLCKEHDCSIKELWDRNGEDFSLSTDLRMQLKKMLQEQGLEVFSK